MKRLVIVIVSIMALLCSQSVEAKRANASVKGQILNEKGEGAPYATLVVLASDSTQVTGVTADESGKFALLIDNGRYTLRVIYMGYESVSLPIVVSGELELDPITLTPAATTVEEVKVTARLITREADRFVVNVTGNPTAIGKDAYEMLRTAPGVWSDGKNLSVNGKGGTRVMINDHLMNLSGEDLIAYLKNISAEDIVKIEVIPTAGADYDADSQGGVIKITLRRQRDNGLVGAVALTVGTGVYNDMYVSPSASINYNTGKLNVYANGRFAYDKYRMSAVEHTTFADGRSIDSESAMPETERNGRGTFGAVYDISQRQSVGGEVNVRYSHEGYPTMGTSTLLDGQSTVVNTSDYLSNSNSNYIASTLNYQLKLDTLGSMFKLIGDFTSRLSDADNSYKNKAETSIISSDGDFASRRDTLYRNTSSADYKIYSLTANFDLILSPKTTVKAGAKFTYNDMFSDQLYEGFHNKVWTRYDPQSYNSDYSERIAAIYGIYNTRLGIVGLSAGLRGEYTGVRADGSSASTRVSQNYFSLFPNANVSVALNKKQSNSIVAAYSRKIERPSFWELTPSRVQLSEYSYIAGNPDLNPSYINDFSLTGVLAYKYSLTFGAQLIVDQVQQMVVSDPTNPDMLIYRTSNLARNWQYYLAANAPIQLTPWWSANINLTGVSINQKITADTPVKSMLFFSSYTTMNFTLPRGFSFDLEHYYQSRGMSANMEMMPMWNMGAGLKKQTADKRFTFSLNISGIFNQQQEVITTGDGFSKQALIPAINRRYVSMSIRYNFKAGKVFRAKTVESGAGDDAARIEKSK